VQRIDECGNLLSTLLTDESAASLHTALQLQQCMRDSRQQMDAQQRSVWPDKWTPHALPFPIAHLVRCAYWLGVQFFLPAQYAQDDGEIVPPSADNFMPSQVEFGGFFVGFIFIDTFQSLKCDDQNCPLNINTLCCDATNRDRLTCSEYKMNHKSSLCMRSSMNKRTPNTLM
jgi:hypothetical protein